MKIPGRKTEIFTNSQENKPRKKERKPSFMKIFNDKKDKNQFKLKDIDQVNKKNGHF